jgi:hypothetical protein
MKHGPPWAIALIVLAAVFPVAAQAAPADCAHLRLVASTADARVVLASVSDIVADDFPAVDAAVAPGFSLARLFAVEDADASCPTAWVLVQGLQASVRVAGPGRARFVFRELSVSTPLAELDRERVGQVVRAALTALQQDAESLDRQHALAAAGVTTPPPAAAPAAVAQSIDPEPNRLPVESKRSVPEPNRFFLDRYSIGVSYGGVMNQDYFWQGPGVTLAVGGTPWRWDPELWLDAQYLLPHSFEQPDVTNQTVLARAGVSAAWRWLRFGLGAGLNREELRARGDSIDLGATWHAGARAFACATFFQRGGFVATATLLFDAVQSSAHSVFTPLAPTDAFNFYEESFWRPGLSLTLGWRS